jgi:glycerophosphoryl diester phosphodiesterase
MRTRTALTAALLLAPAALAAQAISVGPRPYLLVEVMRDGALKDKLESCEAGPFQRTDFSIGHRGAPLMFPEHTVESNRAAARMGAGVLECDVAFTKDRALVCRHAQCDLHTTTDILTTPLAQKCSEPFTPASGDREASAKCCVSDITLAEFRTLRGKMDAYDPAATTPEAYQGGTANWRTDLYAEHGALMTHAESIALFRELGAKFTPELKSPEVDMPYEGDFTQAEYAQKLVDEYEAAGVPPSDVWPQSFNYGDVLYWIENTGYGAQAVYLDGRYDDEGFDPSRPEALSPSFEEMKADGVNIVAPPMWVLVTLDESGAVAPSEYAKQARAAGLDLITWTLERSGPLQDGGGWYHQSVEAAAKERGDALTYELLDVLAQEVGVLGVFSDWPGTTTYYANCMGL